MQIEDPVANFRIQVVLDVVNVGASVVGSDTSAEHGAFRVYHNGTTRIRASEIFKPTASTGTCREPVDIRNIDLGTTSLSPGSSYLMYTTVANGVPNGEYDFRVDEINTQNEVIRHAETLSYQVRNKLEFTLSPTVDTANAALGESIDINADFTSGDFVNIYLYGPVGDAAATTQKLSSSFVCSQRLYRFVWTPPRSTKAGTYEVFLRTQDYPVESNRVPVYILNPTTSPSPSVSPTPTPEPTTSPDSGGNGCTGDFSIQEAPIKLCLASRINKKPVELRNRDFCRTPVTGSISDPDFELLNVYDFDNGTGRSDKVFVFIKGGLNTDLAPKKWTPEKRGLHLTQRVKNTWVRNTAKNSNWKPWLWPSKWAALKRQEAWAFNPTYCTVGGKS